VVRAALSPTAMLLLAAAARREPATSRG